MHSAGKHSREANDRKSRGETQQQTERGGPSIRVFASGATRDSDEGKYDYEGFLSPFALRRFAAYMHRNRKQPDGSLRDSDNWQRGIPRDALIKSAWRHFHAWWTIHRGGRVQDERDGHEVDAAEALCGLLFNAMAYLHEITRPRG